MAIPKILVVIDPTRDEQPAFYRAMLAAKMQGYSLLLFTSLYKEFEAGKLSKNHAVQDHLNKHRDVLEKFAEQARQKNIDTTIEVDWDRDWSSAVVRASIRHNVDIVFKSTFKHSVAQRVIRKTSDWTLLRSCLCPVLLVREGTRWESHRVLAAVDMENDDSAHQMLNKAIIDLSKQVAGYYNSEVHYINAYSDSLAYPDNSYLESACGVPIERIHSKVGTPEDVIINISKELKPDLVLIGTVARTGVSGWISGNTTEKVLDRVECDVLTLP
jgi:universal stress protein E